MIAMNECFAPVHAHAFLSKWRNNAYNSFFDVRFYSHLKYNKEYYNFFAFLIFVIILFWLEFYDIFFLLWIITKKMFFGV